MSFCEEIVLKKSLLILITILMIFTVGCKEKKVVHCDTCGIEIKINADSAMTDDWSIYCTECSKSNDFNSAATEPVDDGELAFN